MGHYPVCSRKERLPLVSYPQSFHRWAMISCGLSCKQDKGAGKGWVGGGGPGLALQKHQAMNRALNNPEDSSSRRAVAPTEPVSYGS